MKEPGKKIPPLKSVQIKPKKETIFDDLWHKQYKREIVVVVVAKTT